MTTPLKKIDTFIIDDIIEDYSVRELQIVSSKILSEHEATNNFIKKFKADHDSHQFYRNVIKVRSFLNDLVVAFHSH